MERDKEAIKAESYRLSYGVRLLRQQGMKNTQILQELNKALPSKLQIRKGSQFSKYLGAHKEGYEHYIRSINESAFAFMFPVLDGLILEKCNKTYDEGSNSYLGDGELPVIVGGKGHAKRFLGLRGIWKAYSWNKDWSTDKEPKVNVFKFNIAGLAKVVCITENTRLEYGKLGAIGENKIEIEVYSKKEIAYFIGHIGIGDFAALQKTNFLHLVYVYSADTRPKAGKVVLERTNEEFLSIETGIKSLSSLEPETAKKLLPLLKETQVIAEV